MIRIPFAVHESIRASRAAGARPLDPALRVFFEDRFGRDLHGVRIHTDQNAARAARGLAARAFTLGDDVFFGAGEFAPHSPAGRRLLAHELAHCVQQRPGAVPPCVGAGAVDDPCEAEADAAADCIMRGGRAPRLTLDHAGLIRRAGPPIVAGSAKITITSRPSVNQPTIDVAHQKAKFNGSNIQADGEVTLTAGGWELGFLQAQWIETNWVHYRGHSVGDGSLLLQRGHPPARARQACRDTVGPVADIWYNAVPGQNQNAVVPGGAVFPLKLTAHFFDNPSDDCNLVEVNSLNGADNFLREAQFEFHFNTVLSLRETATGNFHHLLNFFWNAHWQTRFLPAAFTNPAPAAWTITSIAGGNSASVSHVIQGGPTDGRFIGVLTSAQTQNCNQLFAAAETSVETAGFPGRHEITDWASIPVGK